MKKIIIVIVVFLITMVSVSIYVESSRLKNDSYSTPEEALSTVDGDFNVVEIIDMSMHESVAYVLFYSELDTPKDFLAVGKLKKGKYGWRFDGMYGVGRIIEDSVGMITAKDDYIIGLVSKNIEKVVVGNNDAKMITLDKTEMKVWVFHGIEADLMEIDIEDIKYFDKEGNEIPY